VVVVPIVAAQRRILEIGKGFDAFDLTDIGQGRTG
jgi:hypothetical protein